MDIAVLEDHRVKTIENPMRDKYLNLAREQGKRKNIRLTVIPVVIGELGTITKGLETGLEELGIGGQIKTI